MTKDSLLIDDNLLWLNAHRAFILRWAQVFVALHSRNRIRFNNPLTVRPESSKLTLRAYKVRQSPDAENVLADAGIFA